MQLTKRGMEFFKAKSPIIKFKYGKITNWYMKIERYDEEDFTVCSNSLELKAFVDMGIVRFEE